MREGPNLENQFYKPRKQSSKILHILEPSAQQLKAKYDGSTINVLQCGFSQTFTTFTAYATKSNLRSRMSYSFTSHWLRSPAEPLPYYCPHQTSQAIAKANGYFLHPDDNVPFLRTRLLMSSNMETVSRLHPSPVFTVLEGTTLHATQRES